MNGAMAELCPKVNNTPSSSNMTTIGSSHQRLFLARYDSNSPAIPKRSRIVEMKFITRPGVSYFKHVSFFAHPYIYLLEFCRIQSRNCLATKALALAFG